MDDDEIWKKEARQQGIDAATGYLLECIFTMYFKDHPAGAVPAFSTFAGGQFDLLRRKPMIDMPADRTAAAVSDIAEGIVADFLDRVAARLGIPVPPIGDG